MTTPTPKPLALELAEKLAFQAEVGGGDLAELELAADELRRQHQAIVELRTALARVERWFGEFPETGEFWDAERTRPMSYAAVNGSNGERDYMRAIARATRTKQEP